MTTTIRIQLRGDAEKFVKSLHDKYGLNEREVIERALGMLKMVEETQRVALLTYEGISASSIDDLVDSILTVADTSTSEPPQGGIPAKKATPNAPHEPSGPTTRGN